MNGSSDMSAFLSRKSGGGSKYNYDLQPLIKDFSFVDFIANAYKNSVDSIDYGAFLVITNNQYIIGYNAGFGVGTHIASFARTMMDINGGGNISNDKEALELNRKCKNSFITARIVYDCIGENENRRPIYSGCINFNLDSIPITKQQFEVFKKFYEDYNSELEKVIRRCTINNFCVWVSYKDKDDKLCVNKSGNLDNLYSFLEKHIDEKKEIEDDVVILGVEVSKGSKKKF